MILRLWKRQSLLPVPTTVLLRTTLTRTIRAYDHIKVLPCSQKLTHVFGEEIEWRVNFGGVYGQHVPDCSGSVNTETTRWAQNGSKNMVSHLCNGRISGKHSNETQVSFFVLTLSDTHAIHVHQHADQLHTLTELKIYHNSYSRSTSTKENFDIASLQERRNFGERVLRIFLIENYTYSCHLWF